MQNISRLLRNNRLCYIIVIIVYALCLYFVGRNILSAELWYDEAGQVFIAHGLNHWSEPMSPDGNLVDAFTANHDYNQDPGGYTALLYFWCKISSNHIWLRLLSFFFFLGTIVFTCLISFQILNNKLLAFISGLMVFALNGGNFAHEIRAYSMELCGVVYGIWMVLEFRKDSSIRKTILMALGLCFFITARYTMLVIGGILSCFVVYELMMHYKDGLLTKSKLALLIAIYSVPLLITVFIIWKYQMAYQNPDAKSLSYIQYIQGGKFLILYIALAIISLMTWRWQNDSCKLLITIFVIINAAFLFLGALSILPWNISGNKGAVFMLLLNITIFNCCTNVLMKNTRIFPYLTYLVLLGWTAYMLVIKHVGIANISRDGFRVSQIESALKNGEGPIYVSSWNSPEVRYLYEYGVLKDKVTSDNYPERFIFLKRDKHCVGIKKKNFKKINACTLESLPVGTVVYLTNTYTDSVPNSYFEFEKGLYIKLFFNRH